MVFNISAISWRSALLVVDTVIPGENLSQVTDKLLSISLYQVHLNYLSRKGMVCLILNVSR